MKLLSESRCFGGRQQQWAHEALTTSCTMRFSIFLPEQAREGRVPVLYWLSGLTCTDENFTQKAGAQRYAAEEGVAFIAPDTSPRGEGVPDDPDGAYDFGLGAGFYVNATQEPWARHYRMYDYIVDELPRLVDSELPVDGTRAGILGHSMGGHGALTIALKNPGRYRSVSAFSPICSPINCPWGQKALSGYLGPDRQAWRDYDATCLLSTAGERLPLLVDQGDADDFLAEQLKPGLLEEACRATGHPLSLRMRRGYDHSYYFIATFIGEHVRHHAGALKR